MNLRSLFSCLVALWLLPLIVLGQNSQQELNDQLWEATRKGDVTAVRALLDKGADVNAKFRYGTTALFKAAERGHVEVVKILLERGADVSVKDTFYGATAMTWALNNKHLEVVRALLEKEPAIAGDVLLTGAREGNTELVRLALDKGGIKPDALTSALANSMNDKDKSEIAEMLKKAGAKPPFEVHAATLQTYAGRYKPEQGAEIVFSVQDGEFLATPTGQRSFALMALDKTTFKPIAFDAITVIFVTEGDKVTSLTLKQGQTSTLYKKVEETRQP